MTSIYPFDIRYGISRGGSFQEHRSRSKMPGTDYLTPIGTPIYAPWSGWVQQEKPSDMKGAIAISITRNQPGNVGDKIYFIHLSRTVNVGRNVTTGELIGYSGNTGNTTGPHTCIPYRPIWDRPQYVDVAPILSRLPLRSELQITQPSTPTIDQLNQKVQELDKARQELAEALQSEKLASAQKLIDKQVELEEIKSELTLLSDIVEEHTDRNEQALLIKQVSMDTTKDLGEKLVDGGKYVALAQPIGAFFGLLLAKALNVTGDEIVIVTAGATALVNLSLVVLNHFLKIF